jgi:uncharacterized protein (DUF305 family)
MVTDSATGKDEFVMRLLAILSLLAALAVVAAGCGDDDDSPAMGNATDVAFVNDMTRHHEAAIEMAEMAEDRAEHPELRAMARDIVSAQRGEIADMRRMHDAMGDDMEHGMHGGDMGMSDHAMGMDMDMDALESARPFDEAFLEAMIDHHRGAITMSRELLEKGESSELRDLGQSIIDAQTREIEQMRAWMEDWYGEGR